MVAGSECGDAMRSLAIKGGSATAREAGARPQVQLGNEGEAVLRDEITPGRYRVIGDDAASHWEILDGS